MLHSLQAGEGSALFFFQATASLPTAEETALSDTMTQSANAAVLRKVQAEWPRKCEAYTAFSAEQRASVTRESYDCVPRASKC